MIPLNPLTHAAAHWFSFRNGVPFVCSGIAESRDGQYGFRFTHGRTM
jgi:hypothetical protein